MRLNNAEVAGIVNGIEPFIKNHSAELRLYGSRVDDNKKGGDIDLILVVHDAKNSILDVKHKILSSIKKNIGDRKIDLLICDKNDVESDPFIALVFPSSISLKKWK